VIILGDDLLGLHEQALRAAAVAALQEWLAGHSVAGRGGRVAIDAVGQAIIRALDAIDEPLQELGESGNLLGGPEGISEGR
jgi:hypothetical protein